MKRSHKDKNIKDETQKIRMRLDEGCIVVSADPERGGQFMLHRPLESEIDNPRAVATNHMLDILSTILQEGDRYPDLLDWALNQEIDKLALELNDD